MRFAHGLRLCEVDGGVLVEQGDRAYVARRWRLLDATRDLVEGAMAAGLRWMIRDGHPQAHALWPNENGRACLAFSPTRDKQWSVAVDALTKHASAYRVPVINGKYRNTLSASDAFNTGPIGSVLAAERVPEAVRYLARANDVQAFEITFPFQMERCA